MVKEEIMQQILLFATILAPIITGLVELVKRTINVKKNFVPLISFGIGLAIGLLAYPFTEMDWVLRIWAGGLAGLSATGLFELFNHREGTTKEGDK